MEHLKTLTKIINIKEREIKQQKQKIMEKCFQKKTDKLHFGNQ